MKRSCVLIFSLAFLSYPIFAGVFDIIHNFDGVSGTRPYGSVVISGGMLYGTTVRTNSSTVGGTVFKLDTDGSDFEILHSFTDSTADGNEVYNGLTIVENNIYGITRIGGTSNNGVLFKIDGESNFSVIHNFTGTGGGMRPYTAPTYYNGALYGLTYGNLNLDTHINTESYLYKYDLATDNYSILQNMASPYDSPFGTVTVINGRLYGMNSSHTNPSAYGNIFSYDITTSSYEVVHTFSGGTAGGYPYDSLVWDGGNYVYGTALGLYPVTGVTDIPTALSDEGVVFRLNINNGEYAVLHDFSSQSGDGAKPNSSMLIAPDGWLYGIAHGNQIWGGTEYGTFYRMKFDGSDFEVLHIFDSMEDGNVPMRSLVWDEGIIYGTTAYGGEGTGLGYGTVWSYNTLIPEPTISLAILATFSLIIRKKKS